MLHRLNLRVLPSLNALVTAPEVRKRKRLVMLAPGLVAFGLYRLMKQVIPLSDPFVLLAFSGTMSSLTAAWAYRMGRGIPLAESFREDGWRCFAWLIGWIGFVYGVQLSLLVLALLKLFVNYDFLVHPEGPAMMAIIIACTSVTRDAFEIGYVQRMARESQSVVTFPDGKSFRQWVQAIPTDIGKWVCVAMTAGIAGSWFVGSIGTAGNSELIQAIVMSAIAACLAFLAFHSGEFIVDDWIKRLKAAGWIEALRFWIWPCFTFAITYYLVQAAIFTFLARIDVTHGLLQMVIAGTTAGMMTGYCFYLGKQKIVEARSPQNIPENLRNCPFVMGMLQKVGVLPSGKDAASVGTLSAGTEKVG